MMMVMMTVMMMMMIALLNDFLLQTSLIKHVLPPFSVKIERHKELLGETRSVLIYCTAQYIPLYSELDDTREQIIGMYGTERHRGLWALTILPAF